MSSEKVLYRHEEPHGQGDVYCLWQTGASAQLLASTGSDGTVAIFNRQGQLQERIVLQGLCAGFAWDRDGDVLAIITANSPQLIVWDSNSQKKQTVDIGLRDLPSCIIWSKKIALLAVGTTRGNLSIYNHITTKRIPILGKHTKRITCGAWSTENILALGSEDKYLTLSNEEGDTLRSIQLRDCPSDMYFAEMKTDERVPGENTISMILGKRTLFLYHLPEPDSPTELGFQQRYGSLLQHKWFADGYILLGFSLGHVVAISTHPREVGQELWQVKNHRDSLNSIAVCKELELIASCGDNNVKIHSMTNLQETVKILSLPDQAALKHVEWSADGQLLGVTTSQGAICVFVTKLHSLYAVTPPRIAILSSLAEIAIYHYTPDRQKAAPALVTLEIEPSFLAIGPYHMACGMNNHVWFYDLGRTLTDSPLLLGDREYMSEIKQVALSSEYCAVLCGGQIMLHPVESTNEVTLHREPKIFPDEVRGLAESVITCLGLTNEFLCFATDLGNIIYFSLENWCTVVQYRHQAGIRSIHPDVDGTRTVFIDDHSQGYLFVSASEETLRIPDFPKHCPGILWDYSQPHVFVANDRTTCTTYVFVRGSVRGKLVEKVGTTSLISEQTPLMLYDGDLCLHGSGGKLTSIVLDTHANKPGRDAKEQLRTAKLLRKYADAWELCKLMNDTDEWKALGMAAIADLNVPFATKVFRNIGNVAMVYALEEISQIEDMNTLAGFCAVLLDDIDEAKTLFAKGGNPAEALELCRDLLQWEQAMALANTLAPEQLPFLAREYGAQLEFTGNHAEALMNFERGLKNFDAVSSAALKKSPPDVKHLQDVHVKLCKAGIARTSIKCGDVRRGLQLALELNDMQLFNECGEAMLTAGHLNEAAIMLERGENWDKAAELLIQLKQWKKVDHILPHVVSLKLHASYAKAKELEGHYADAINSYQLAGDLDSVVRIYLEHLSDPHSASEILLETRSIEGSKLLAKYFEQHGDYESAIQFLVLCGCVTEAFAIAQKQNKIVYYGEVLEQSASAKAQDFLLLASYFDSEKYTMLAGKYYFLGKEYSKSLKLLLKAASVGNEENAALSLAIDCVASAGDEKLSNQLIEYLLGESDGVPKDPKLLFRLYMAKRQFKEAAKAAMIIANQEQIAGNYRSAHDLLFSMYQELKRNNLAIATDMKSTLALLHRYTLVRIHVKRGNHLLAAKLLLQVANSISQFPSHVVPILTSTVIECHRTGLRKSAFEYAVMLMRSEFRGQIDSKYAKKVESIVRKASRGQLEDEGVQDSSPCPVCEAPLPNMHIVCGQCKTTLPICVATGQHIVRDDIAACPECDFPAMKAEFLKILETTNNQCAMCGEEIDAGRLVDIDDIQPYIDSGS
ncbi:WD repeat-containing protein 19 [Anopheles ziemanni]|uniref:WD repeat-containing protein 19 n=1 Tax=Anopheles coustani TaxID=139045 RepID=UPI002659A17F|nr:WD repeat-containing protein 19 [Anopheles coustani]XP_058171035.1 WD repeat-containing protein 19 [Anopheles ziemanni]